MDALYRHVQWQKGGVLSKFRLMIAVLAAMIFVVVVLRWGSEFSAVMASPSVSEVYSIAADEVPKLPNATSTFAITRQMEQCDNWMTSIVAGFASEQALQNIAIACEARADDILASTPSFSLAHLVKAGVARTRSDADVIVQSLSAAQITAPFEGALATRRLRLFFLSGPDVTATSLENDVKVVAMSPNFRPFLAQFYWTYPERRTWLTEVFEALPPNAARRVVATIKKAAPGGIQ